MAFTKITAAGIGSTETVTLDGLSVINNESIGGNLTVTGNATIGGVLTYEDVTNVDSVGLITARNGIVVGSGITLSKDGDIFATGISTFSGPDVLIGTGITLSSDGDATFTGVVTFTGPDVHIGTGVTLSPDGDATFAGIVTATSFVGDGSDLTGLAAGGAFVKGVVGVTTLTPVGIETSTVTRKDLIGPAGNTSTGAGSSFHGAYMGDGFLSFNTEFSNSSGYYISTFTNALVAGPMQLGSTMTIDGTFTIV